MSKSQIGPGDAAPGEYTVTFTSSGQATVRGPGITRQTEVRMLVEDQGISLAFGTTLPPHLADLLDIAVAAYVADRLCVRRPRSARGLQSDQLWQRRITLRLPLRNPGFWSSERCHRVAMLLGFITDDTWTLEFTQGRPRHRLSETQGSLFPDVPVGDVTSCLLSGGLDSMAGLTAELVGHPSRTIVAFSARTNRRIGAYQRDQVQALTSRFGARLRHIPATIRLKDRVRGAYDREEPSQRTRGFVFQIFGAVTAALGGIDSLHVYENGVGALNLPYSASQLGAQATRATNPLTIALASDLVSGVISQPFRVCLPHRFDTKAEMVSVFRDAGLRDLIQLTISCDNFPQRFPRTPQCGLCPSCLLSRQSLYSAGLRDADPSFRFRHNVYDMEDEHWTEHSYHLRVMTMQAATLNVDMQTPAPWATLIYRYPLLHGVAEEIPAPDVTPDLRDNTMALLKRYSNEWLAFWTTVRPRTKVLT